MNLAQRILQFNDALNLDDISLPTDIAYLNPFKGEYSKQVLAISEEFYQKYYTDNHKRFIIFGINPGRLGAGLTGIPFTDTHGLEQECGISARGIETRETSAVFVYEMIKAFGGPEKFYRYFFIGAVSPLGFVCKNDKGRMVNYNYYDQTEVQNLLCPTLKKWMLEQYKLGMYAQVAFCFGTGKNHKALLQLNKELKLFDEIIPLEHPRFIMQYRNKTKDSYIDKYLEAFHKAIALVE